MGDPIDSTNQTDQHQGSTSFDQKERADLLYFREFLQRSQEVFAESENESGNFLHDVEAAGIMMNLNTFFEEIGKPESEIKPGDIVRACLSGETEEHEPYIAIPYTGIGVRGWVTFLRDSKGCLNINCVPEFAIRGEEGSNGVGAYNRIMRAIYESKIFFGAVFGRNLSSDSHEIRDSHSNIVSTGNFVEGVKQLRLDPEFNLMNGKYSRPSRSSLLNQRREDIQNSIAVVSSGK